MTRSYLADEHVRRVFVLSLRENGYDVVWIDGGYDPGTPDTAHLERSEETDRVIVSNDADFVRLHADYDHAGVILYADQTRSVRAFIRGIRRIGRYVPDETLRRSVVWLDEWTR